MRKVSQHSQPPKQNYNVPPPVIKPHKQSGLFNWLHQGSIRMDFPLQIISQYCSSLFTVPIVYKLKWPSASRSNFPWCCLFFMTIAPGTSSKSSRSVELSCQYFYFSPACLSFSATFGFWPTNIVINSSMYFCSSSQMESQE